LPAFLVSRIRTRNTIYRSGGNEKWCERLDKIRLEKLIPLWSKVDEEIRCGSWSIARGGGFGQAHG